MNFLKIWFEYYCFVFKTFDLNIYSKSFEIQNISFLKYLYSFFLTRVSFSMLMIVV